LRKLSEKGMLMPIGSNPKDKPARISRYQAVFEDFHGFQVQ